MKGSEHCCCENRLLIAVSSQIQHRSPNKFVPLYPWLLCTSLVLLFSCIHDQQGTKDLLHTLVGFQSQMFSIIFQGSQCRTLNEDIFPNTCISAENCPERVHSHSRSLDLVLPYLERKFEENIRSCTCLPEMIQGNACRYSYPSNY